MTIPGIIYSDYYPSTIKVQNLAISVSENTLSNLPSYLENTRLLVAESLTYNNPISNQVYGLIVDDEGLGVHTTIQKRNSVMNSHAMYIDGDVYISGKVMASNYIPIHDTAYDHLKVGEGDYTEFDGTDVTGDLKATGLIGGGTGFWYLSDANNNSVYYPGKAVIGDRTTANMNGHGLNINKLALRDIDKSQLNIKNTQNSEMRLGVLGSGRYNQSPAIINTNSNTKIEFHIGRDQDYFSNMYYNTIYTGFTCNYTTGENIPIQQVVPLDSPNYPLFSDVEYAPHLQIDEVGNVGIHTSANPVLNYSLRTYDPENMNNIVYLPMSNSANLHVEGVTYTRDLVVYDYESGTTKNIDELYVRHLGVIFAAKQIQPGVFGNGDYIFPENLEIQGNLKVDNNTHTNTLTVDNTSSLGDARANTLFVSQTATVQGDSYFNGNVNIDRSLQVNSGIFVPTLQSDGSMAYTAVQFQVANPDLSNINYFGNGITTPGKFGTGINPNTDDVYSQLTIIKHDPSDTSMEIEILDKSSSNFFKGAYIGHPQAEIPLDASLVFATPAIDDATYALNNDTIKQNMYFFAGTDLTNDAIPLIRESNPPTFGIFAGGQIGVGTYAPRATCDIQGSLMFSDSLYFNNNGNQIEIGLWKTTRRTMSCNVLEYYPVTITSNYSSNVFTSNQIFSYLQSNVTYTTSNVQVLCNVVPVLYTSNYTQTQYINIPGICNNYPININIAGSFTSNQSNYVSVLTSNAQIQLIPQSCNIPIYTLSNFTSNYQAIASSNQQVNVLGDILGIQYYNSNAPFVAINTAIDTNYILNVGGSIHTTDHYYTNENKRACMWIDSSDPSISNYSAPQVSSNLFTYNNVGIGVTQPVSPLEIKNNFSGETSLKLIRGDNNVQTTSVEFADSANSWFIKGQSATANLFQIAQNSSTFTSPTNIRPLYVTYDNILQQYQTFIGCDLNAKKLINVNGLDADAALTVNGNMNVLGNVNATGLYKINGAVQIYNSNMGNSSNISVNQDDIYISGENIILNPNTGNSVLIGLPSVNSTVDKNSLLRVYQTSDASSNAIVCSLRNAGRSSLISLIAEGSIDAGSTIPKELRFGVFSPVEATNPNISFMFTDENNLPYIAFQTNAIQAEKYVGFNTSAPTAMLHVSTTSVGSNMLKLTKQISQYSTSDTGPCLELETFESDTEVSNKWTVTGPLYNNRLGFVYNQNEVMSISPDGFIGIGTTTPMYALDIYATDGNGSLRLWNSGVNPSPQLIFQSGCNVFGEDPLTDYLMYSSSNNFKFIAENVAGNTQTVLHINDTGRIGIGTTSASNLFDINLFGSVNIQTALYINGSLLFNAANNDNTTNTTNFTAAGINVLIRPDPNAGGGVVINGRSTKAYGNLLQVYSGINANMGVFDSSTPNLQLNFRVQNDHIGSGLYNTYRMGIMQDGADSELYWEYNGHAPYTGFVSDSHTGFTKFKFVEPSKRASAPNEFDETLNGCLTLNSPNAALNLGSSCVLKSVNGSGAILTTSNLFGIGTSNPASGFHVALSNSPMILQQLGAGNMLQIQSSNAITIVDTNGNIGINTTAPLAALDVAAGTIVTPMGNVTSPSYSFRTDTLTGIFSPGVSNIGIVTGGTNRLLIDQNGTCTMMSGSVGFSSDILRLMSGSNLTTTFQANGNMIQTGSIIPSSNAAFDLGSSNYRWRDIYISGNSVDIQSTRLTRTNVGDIMVSSSNVLKGVISSTLNLGGSLLISPDPSNIVTFSVLDSNNSVQSSFSPLAINNVNSSISLGTNVQDATMHLTTPSNIPFPTLILENLNNSNILQVKNKTGSNLLIIDNNGNLGIGSTTPKSALDILTSGGVGVSVKQLNPSSNVATFSGTTSSIVVNGQGNLGINTLNPQAPLHVVGQQIFDGNSLFTSNVTITNLITSSVNVNTSNQDATVHITTPSNAIVPTLILENLNNSNILQVRNRTGNDLIVINNAGNIGIGSTKPQTCIDILTSNIGISIKQTNPSSNIATLTGTSNNIVVNGQGFLGVNTSNPTAPLHVIGQQLYDGWSTFTSNVTMQANLVVSGNTITHGNAITDSDLRLKTDIKRIENALEKINKLSGYTFTRINDSYRSTGLIAQEVQSVLPEVVDKVGMYHLGVAYGNMMGLVVEAIKELTTEIQTIKTHLNI